MTSVMLATRGFHSLHLLKEIRGRHYGRKPGTLGVQLHNTAAEHVPKTSTPQ